MIEDYHNGVKTGGKMEQRQDATGARVERVLGVLLVAALRLLPMRSRSAKRQPLTAAAITNREFS